MGMISIRLDEATEADVRAVASRAGLSMSDYVRSTLRKDLDDRHRGEAPWARFVGCGSSGAAANRRGQGDTFAAAVDEKFERIDRERARRREARDAD